MGIYVQKCLNVYKIGHISVKNGPIFKPKPPLESSEQSLSAHKSMRVDLLRRALAIIRYLTLTFDMNILNILQALFSAWESRWESTHE